MTHANHHFTKISVFGHATLFVSILHDAYSFMLYTDSLLLPKDAVAKLLVSYPDPLVGMGGAHKESLGTRLLSCQQPLISAHAETWSLIQLT